MKKIEFSKTSLARLETCSESIVSVVEDAAKCSPVVFDVVTGAVTIDELRSMYKKKMTLVNPDSFVEKQLKTKTKYKKDLYKKVPNLVEKKKDKSRAFSINCPGSTDQELNMVIGLILGTANRLLKKKEQLIWTQTRMGIASFELISK